MPKKELVLQPLADRLIVKREEAVDRVGSIYLPDAAQEKPVRGKVLAVGPSKATDLATTVPINVKIGDTVLFTKWAGNDVEHEGESYLILNESDVLAVVATR